MTIGKSWCEVKSLYQIIWFLEVPTGVMKIRNFEDWNKSCFMSSMLSSILSSRQRAQFLYKATECCSLPQSFQFFVCVEPCAYVCVAGCVLWRLVSSSALSTLFIETASYWTWSSLLWLNKLCKLPTCPCLCPPVLGLQPLGFYMNAGVRTQVRLLGINPAPPRRWSWGATGPCGLIHQRSTVTLMWFDR